MPVAPSIELVEAQNTAAPRRIVESRSVVGRGRGGRRPLLFSTEGRVPHSPTFWTEIRANVSPLLQLVTC